MDGDLIGLLVVCGASWCFFFLMIGMASQDPAPSQGGYNNLMIPAFVIGVGSAVMIVGRLIYLFFIGG